MPNMEFLMGVTLLFKVTSIEYDPFKQCCDLEIEFSDARNQFNPFQIKAKVTQNEPLMIGKKHQTQLLSQPKSYLDTISRDQCTIQMGQKDQLILKNVSSKGTWLKLIPGVQNLCPNQTTIKIGFVMSIDVII